MYLTTFIMGEQLNSKYIFTFFGNSFIRNAFKVILTIIFIIPHYALFLVQFVLALFGSIPLLGIPFLIVNVIITFLLSDNILRLMLLPYLREINEDRRGVSQIASAYLRMRAERNQENW